ncbi:substrate-binding domain-containing protein [Actinopolymorpha rutila]|uniref:DNA-binding LacI/PurR family transcriptional regulator n=1 Tax=Actinopolymorpha rutila TaxID=446787 RepID=A0A852ZGJ5_9ACTN|nr:DNA-binding LacI/PurR family transcriptional regulator [Actinopolymorpha rutila]
MSVLRQEVIVSGRTRRPPGLADVARQAGVSPSLVSRILRGDETVRAREDTRRRVLKAAEQIGYVPHQLARNLRTSRAGCIGLVVHDVGNPIYGEIVRGAQRAVSRAGSILMVADAEAITDQARLLQIAGGGRVDGLLWQMAGHAELDELVRVAARYVPVVLVNSESEGELTGVHLDDERAAELAMGHLLELGHERIGFVSGVPGSRVSERRRRSYRQALRAAGIRRHAAWDVEGGWDPGSGHHAMERLLRARPRVTAVLVTNAVVATGVISAAYDAGVHVPDDLSVVAIHDIWFAERLTPPLTVVRLPLEDMGERAAQVLLDEDASAGPASIAVAEPAPELVVRASTAPPSR